MLKSEFFPTLRRLKLKKKYIYFSIGYGLSTLIIPFATQFLVNNLALGGLWLNTITFIVIIGLGLTISQIFKYCQILLSEYLQREIFMNEVQHWKESYLSDNSYYFFEVVTVLKSFSKVFTTLIEIGLVLTFGLTVIMLFHPIFILLPSFLAVVIFFIFSSWDRAVETSIEESNQKYNLYYTVKDGSQIQESEIDKFLIARNDHFWFIKRNKIIMGITYVISQLAILGIGIYLIQINELSVGQLVSAEIILSGILSSLTRLPKTLESLYDFETSKYKIKKALTGVDHE